MVAASDFSNKSGALNGKGASLKQPKQRRFRLLSALAAPFTDVDERAVRKKGAAGVVRNNSKGNMFVK
jgi:hypothetical protein